MLFLRRCEVVRQVVLLVRSLRPASLQAVIDPATMRASLGYFSQQSARARDVPKTSPIDFLHQSARVRCRKRYFSLLMGAKETETVAAEGKALKTGVNSSMFKRIFCGFLGAVLQEKRSRCLRSMRQNVTRQ